MFGSLCCHFVIDSRTVKVADGRQIRTPGGEPVASPPSFWFLDCSNSRSDGRLMRFMDCSRVSSDGQGAVQSCRRRIPRRMRTAARGPSPKCLERPALAPARVADGIGILTTRGRTVRRRRDFVDSSPQRTALHRIKVRWNAKTAVRVAVSADSQMHFLQFR